MQVRVATPDYFSAIGIPLKRGRGFTDDDRAGIAAGRAASPRARRGSTFPNEDPIGKTIKLGWGRGPGKPRAGGEIVGIIGDVKDAGLTKPSPPQIYLPLRQWPVSVDDASCMKTAVPPASLADAVAARGLRRSTRTCRCRTSGRSSRSSPSRSRSRGST